MSTIISTGDRFGRWTVLGNIKLNEKGERKWLCRCDCGTERYVLERSLKYGGSLSCGCGKANGKAYDLTGKRFGKLTVTGKTEGQRKNGGVWWHCICECGAEKDYPATLLTTGRKTSCGCDKTKMYRTNDIAGQKFGSVTALYQTNRRDKKGNVIWHCLCNDCGSEFDVSYNELKYTNRKSCGCKKIRHNEKLPGLLTHVAGTSIDRLRSDKIPKNNTTGYKGVYLIKGKYTAKIVFQQKAYYLGNYDCIEDAVAARQAAEELLMKGTVEHYEKWNAIAENNPRWAKENPIRIKVARKSSREITAEFFPKI